MRKIATALALGALLCVASVTAASAMPIFLIVQLVQMAMQMAMQTNAPPQISTAGDAQACIYRSKHTLLAQWRAGDYRQHRYWTAADKQTNERKAQEDATLYCRSRGGGQASAFEQCIANGRQTLLRQWRADDYRQHRYWTAADGRINARKAQEDATLYCRSNNGGGANDPADGLFQLINGVQFISNFVPLPAGLTTGLSILSQVHDMASVARGSGGQQQGGYLPPSLCYEARAYKRCSQ